MALDVWVTAATTFAPLRRLLSAEASLKLKAIAARDPRMSLSRAAAFISTGAEACARVAIERRGPKTGAMSGLAVFIAAAANTMPSVKGRFFIGIKGHVSGENVGVWHRW